MGRLCSCGWDTAASLSCDAETTLRDALRAHGGGVTVCLVLRRVGCIACREDALALRKLADEIPFIQLVCVVKDATDDATGLHHLHRHYLRPSVPIYQDSTRRLFASLGSRSVRNTRAVLGVRKLLWRAATKRIAFNRYNFFDTLQGGILIFDNNTTVRYAYVEQYADELNVQDIAAAVHAVAARQTMDNNTVQDTTTTMM